MDDFLIGLCTVPFSGALSMAVLSLVAMQSCSLVGLLFAALARPTLNDLANWKIHNQEEVRLTPGGSGVVIDLLILAPI
jgi:hypothetical protein